MATIQLVRKRVSIPDDGFSLQVIFEDQGNPLVDEKGETVLTAEPDGAGGAIPAYPEFVEVIPLPDNITADQETIEGLIATGEAPAAAQAQARADSLAVKTLLLPIIEAINGNGGD